MIYKPVKIYNWHFWLPRHNIQVVVPETCYSRAKNKMGEIFLSYWRCPEIRFQFGELDNYSHIKIKSKKVKYD
jgi:hypothetical protein